MTRRILFVLNDIGGGASQGIYEMLRDWPRRDFAPYAVVPPGQPEAFDRVRHLFDDIRAIPMPWWNVDRAAGRLRRSARALGRWRRGITESGSAAAIRRAIDDWGIDLVHNGTAVTRCGAIAAGRAGVPHLWHVKECLGPGGRLRFPIPDGRVASHIAARSARVVAMSETTAAPFRAAGCTNVEVVPDGVDLAPYLAGDSRRLRARLGLPDDARLVGMVAGTSSHWKEHDVFILAAGLVAAEFPGTRFVVIGPRPRPARWPYDLAIRYDRGLEDLARRAVPTGRLEFLDFIPDPPDIMRSLDILVHPCRSEPFGRVAIEAMAAGTPVVGPRTGGIAETVVDGETGLLVEPGSPEAFARAVASLLRDDHRRRSLGRAGRDHVAGRFSAADHRDRMRAIYDGILGGSTRGRAS